MPTLTRFVRNIAILALIAYGVVAALAHLVEPRTRPMREPLDSRILRDAGRPTAGIAN